MKDKNINEQKKSKKGKVKNKKKLKTWKKVLLVILLIVLILIGWFTYKTKKNGGGLSGMLATVVGHDENTKKNLSEIKVLILGVSNGIEAKLTDTIMVASYNPNTQRATLLSIPRDTYIGSNTAKATAGQKINAIYSISEDPNKVLKEINKLTNLDIKYYLVIETEALKEVVNTIGGVKFNVPINMDYDDTTQDLAIHIKAGEQVLNGEQAEGVVRFRHNNDMTSYPIEYGDNDIGRMRTQREFLKAVMQQTLKLENIFKLNQWLEILHKNVKTNIDFDVAKDYIPYAVEFSTENLLTDTLPGTTPDLRKTNNVSIFVADKKKTQQLVEELFYTRDETADYTVVDENSGENEKNTTSNNLSNIKIEVLNGTGNSKQLTEVVEKLKKAGYNVTKTGTTNSTKKTTIINKKDITQTQLDSIKDNIGIGTISNSKSASSKVDVTIIIGTDYK